MFVCGKSFLQTQHLRKRRCVTFAACFLVTTLPKETKKKKPVVSHDRQRKMSVQILVERFQCKNLPSADVYGKGTCLYVNILPSLNTLKVGRTRCSSALRLTGTFFSRSRIILTRRRLENMAEMPNKNHPPPPQLMIFEPTS